MSKEFVLVTGGSGFIGSHCLIQLLRAGYLVRTTVRSLKRETEVRQWLAGAGVDSSPLTFVEADLTADKGWNEAAAGCSFVLHVASPFPLEIPQHEDDLVVPAREGALRVLRASREAGVKRVVLTSSFAAVGYGTALPGRPYDETDWTNVHGAGVRAYAKSKTLAEQAAWDFIKTEGGALELSVVNPVAVFGPLLAADTSTSILLIQRLLNGAVPGLPHLSFGVVDVRDVADLHLRAMTHPRANGERFLATGEHFVTLKEMAAMLKNRLGPLAKRVPTLQLPNWLVRLVAQFDSSLSQIVPELGAKRDATNEKARTLLGWAPRSNEDALAATGESLARLGLLKPKS